MHLIETVYTQRSTIKKQEVRKMSERKISLQKTFAIITAMLLVFLATVLFSGRAAASPAIPEAIQMTQPSGQSFTATQYGDEFFSYYATESGDIVVLNDDGYWCYAEAETFTYLNSTASKLIAGEARYLIDSRPANALDRESIKALPNPDYLRSEVQKSASPRANSSVQNTEFKYLGDQPVLALLVEFDDLKIQYEDNWYNRIWGTNQKSVKDYYTEVSNGLINLTPATEAYGNANDGIVKVKLDGNHPNPAEKDFYAYKQITIDALAAADEYVDFSIYDTNGNNEIDNNELHIIVIVAGYEKCFGDDRPSVWGHKSYVYETLDGKCTSTYTQFGEVQKRGGDHQATIGVICHELGHDMGLPDLYDIEATTDGLGTYSLMATGSHNYLPGEYLGETPPHLDAYCKLALGIVPATVVEEGTTFEDAVYTFNNTENYNIIKIPTQKPLEYFLIENRQNYKTENGVRVNNSYDASIDSAEDGGLAIYYVDESWPCNLSKGKRRVTILEKSNFRGTPLYRYYVGEFYGVKQKTRLDCSTTPSNQLSDGSYAKFAFECLSPNGEAMNVKIESNKFEFTHSPCYSPICVAGRSYSVADDLINGTGQAVVWSSADEAIAKVDASGMVRGISKGEVKITATTLDGRYTTSATLNVIPAASAVVKMGSETAVLNNNTVYIPAPLNMNSKSMLSLKSLETLFGALIEKTPFGYTISMKGNTILAFNDSLTWRVITNHNESKTFEVAMPLTAVGDEVYVPARDICWFTDINLQYLVDSGTAYLVMTNYSDFTDDYFNALLQTAKPHFNDDYGNSFEKARHISISPVAITAYSGMLEYYNDVDMFTFKAQSTGTYTFSSSDIGTDVKAWLYDSSQTLIASNDDGNGNKNFKLSASVTDGETYYLKIAHFNLNGTGAYTFSIVTDDYGNDFSDPYELNFKAGANPLTGFSSYSGDVDMFKFVAPVSGTYRFATAPTTAHSITLYDDSELELAVYHSTTSFAGNQLSFNFDFIAGETYYMLISGGMEYSLTVHVPN